MQAEMTAIKDIREDYAKHTKWTYAEAAHHAGVEVARVREWACRKMFKKAFMVGPLKVDAVSFLAYLKTGEAQE